MHNNHDSKMMWVMMLMCALPLVILIFASSFSFNSNWFVIGIIVLMIVGHFWFMRRGHKHNDETEDKHHH